MTGSCSLCGQTWAMPDHLNPDLSIAAHRLTCAISRMALTEFGIGHDRLAFGFPAPSDWLKNLTVGDAAFLHDLGIDWQ